MMAILSALIGCQGIDEFREILPGALNLGVTPVEVKEITTQEQFNEACMEATCMLLFVPDIRDSTKTQREAMLATMKAVAEAQVAGLFEYGWVVGGSQYDLEQKLNLGFGYPAVVAVGERKRERA